MLRMPTGINALDRATGGGMPSGSLIFLYGEPATHKSEFAHTIANNCATLASNPVLLPEREDIYLPGNIWYAIFSRSEEEILRDVEETFPNEFYERFSKSVSFKSFLPVSRRLTKPPDWMSDLKMLREPDEMGARTGMLAQLGKFLEKEGPYSLIVLHTLTDIARFFQDEWEIDFTTFLQSLRRMCREWRGVVLSVVTKGILRESLENIMISSADAVLQFEERGDGLRSKQKTVYAKKYRGIPLDLSQPFEMKLTSHGVELERIRTLL